MRDGRHCVFRNHNAHIARSIHLPYKNKASGLETLYRMGDAYGFFGGSAFSISLNKWTIGWYRTFARPQS